MDIQWYPGHMTKARRMMQENLKLVDLIIEILDARAPLSSRNPDLDEMGRGKHRLILLNKADLADEQATNAWCEYYRKQQATVLAIDGRVKASVKAISQNIEVAVKEKRERDRKRGILNRPVRAMVVGIPNVGKSTVINTMAGRASAKTGNTPGVTRGKQWIRLNQQVEMLDTPGVLWPKFEDSTVGLHLAWIGSIRDEVLQVEEMAGTLIDHLTKDHAGALERQYDVSTDGKWYEILERIGEARQCLGRGGQVDLEKAAGVLMDDFRHGKIGRFTVDGWPEADDTSDANEEGSM